MRKRNPGQFRFRFSVYDEPQHKLHNTTLLFATPEISESER
jgi:hypothetical protein